MLKIGFLNFVKKTIQKNQETFDKYYNQASTYSDEDLIRRYKNATPGIRKLAYAKELNNRGYGNSDN